MAVGELFLSAFLKVLFDRLASRGLLQFLLQKGLHGKLKKWEHNLKMVQAVLGDAEEKQLTDRAVKMWLDDLQCLAYDVEDILDEFATEALKTQQHRASASKVRKLIPARLSKWCPSSVKFGAHMRSQIKDISNRLKELCNQRIDLGLQMNAGGESTARQQRPPSSSVQPELAIYGRDEDKDKLLEMVLRNGPSDANFGVISIVGMGGIGKTTLARAVFNDEAVEHFNPRAWVCVSDNFDILGVSKTILESIISKSCDLQDLNQVQLQLKEAVAGRNFLLVLDDVWSTDYSLWEILRSPFLVGAPTSKVIVTTRNKEVALTMGPVDCYNLQILSDEDVWLVFKKHAFHCRDADTYRDFEFFREKVVGKCSGLPLTARTLGGLLRTKQTKNEWEDILSSKIWDLSDESEILPSLKLSYHYLPSYLKRCFAYCAILPKNYEFEENELVLLWIAEGLVQQREDNKQLEELGCKYFTDLLSRSIFQQSSSSKTTYVMHDLINDLAQWVAGETCIRLDDGHGAHKQSKKSGRSRYFSYISGFYDGKDKFEALHEVERLRTFLPVLPSNNLLYKNYLFRKIRPCISNDIISDLLPKFEKLRTLSLQNYYITDLPADSIAGLRHLRHLNLSNTMIRSLPVSVTSLLNLQILLLRNCPHLMMLPSNIENMISLHHLDISGVNLIREMPTGVKELEGLQFLSNFVLGKCTGCSLKDLKKLKFLSEELCISQLENVIGAQNTADAILSNMKHLKVVVLAWRSQFDDSCNEGEEKSVLEMLRPHINVERLTIKGYGGTTLPSWLGDKLFSNMVVLRLERCENCTSLPSLGLLGSLKDLTIKRMRRLKMIGSEIYGQGCLKPFKSLEILSLDDLQEWERWESITENEQVEVFPRLRQLSIVNCRNLSGKLPDHLPSLEKLVIRECAQLVVSLSSLPSLKKLVIHECAQLAVSLSSLPLLCKLNVHGCKCLVWISRTDFKSLNSVTFSNISEIRNWTIQEFQKVECLKISGCEDLVRLWQNEVRPEKPPSGLHSFTSLTKLCIEDCPNLVLFPEVCFLSMLSELEFKICNGLMSLPEGMRDNNARLQCLRVNSCASITSILPEQLPLSLRQLSVCHCFKLQYLLVDREGSCTSSWFASSTCMDIKDITDTSLLEHLYIDNCITLRSLSLPVTLKNLLINGCLELTVLSKGNLPESLKDLKIYGCHKLRSIAEWFHHKMFLEEIKIIGCENLKFLPEGLRNLSCLRRIEICDCPSLVSFPGGGFPISNLGVVSITRCEKLIALPGHMQSIKSLQKLNIRQCSRISIPDKGFPTNLTSLQIENLNISQPLVEWGLHRLTSIRELWISGCCPNVESFPQEDIGMMLPPSLTHLTIENFPNLKHLSNEGFRNLTSLEKLFISHCPNLTSFPEQGLPFTLLQLCIKGCHLLTSRCGRNGNEWSKIAHIPSVWIDNRFIYDLQDEE